jgi:hypothetical protein
LPFVCDAMSPGACAAGSSSISFMKDLEHERSGRLILMTDGQSRPLMTIRVMTVRGRAWFDVNVKQNSIILAKRSGVHAAANHSIGDEFWIWYFLFALGLVFHFLVSTH